MKIKIFGKEINIMVQISSGIGFIETFTTLKEAFDKEGFKNIYIDSNEANISTPAFFPDNMLDRTVWNYFRIKIMDYDEQRFYEFLEKFSKERNITFEQPTK